MFRRLSLWILLGSACAWTQVRPQPAPSQTDAYGRDKQEIDLQQRMDTLHHLPLAYKEQQPRTSPQGFPTAIPASELNVPGKARGEFEKGIKELQKRDFQKAIERFDKALGIYPQFAAAHNNAGVAYMYLGDNDRARGEFEAAARMNTHAATVYENLCRIALAQHKVADAEAAVRKAVALEPHDPEALTLLAFAQLQNRDYDGALASGKTVHAGEHKNFAIVHVVMAYALESQGRLGDAQREYETFVKEDPSNPRVPQAKTRAAELAAKLGSAPKK